ncbi:holin-like protein [Salsuginibacillus halophilus]|uniref:Holin-like protein n=1 Tax=Salsuginibacillus halophilus TaxID=517424 RepID=A0A2P8HE83_9BACI|nr:CidA/LrgA family protein [Salsuginibacillus halophilus]PSL44524.1 holin-like protein [Salsuginibacillus halophilus]
MKFKGSFKIALHLTVIYVIYRLGSWLQEMLQLPVPGSIIGFVLLFLLFQFQILQPAWIAEGVEFLLKHMPLLFIPVTAGVVEHFGLFPLPGLLLVGVVFISTCIVLIIAGGVTQWMRKKAGTV